MGQDSYINSSVFPNFILSSMCVISNMGTHQSQMPAQNKVANGQFAPRPQMPVGFVTPRSWSMAPSYPAYDEAASSVEPQTMIRKWNDDKKPYGTILVQALIYAGLASYTAAAESWCLEMGAAFVSEILEEFDDLCHALSSSGSPSSAGSAISPTQLLRLRHALEVSEDGDRTPQPDEDLPEDEVEFSDFGDLCFGNDEEEDEVDFSDFGDLDFDKDDVFMKCGIVGSDEGNYFAVAAAPGDDGLGTESIDNVDHTCNDSGNNYLVQHGHKSSRFKVGGCRQDSTMKFQAHPPNKCCKVSRIDLGRQPYVRIVSGRLSKW